MWLFDEPKCPICGHTGTIVEAKNGTFWVECAGAMISQSHGVFGFNDARREGFVDYDKQWGDFTTKEQAIEVWREFCASTPITDEAKAWAAMNAAHPPKPQGYMKDGWPFPL